MTTRIETEMMTGPEAYAMAVRHAQEADRLISDDIFHRSYDRAAAHAAISQAFAAIARTAPQPIPASVADEPEPKRRLWLPTRRKTA